MRPDRFDRRGFLTLASAGLVVGALPRWAAAAENPPIKPKIEGDLAWYDVQRWGVAGRPFKDLLNGFQQNWREVVSTATLAGIPVPAFSASLGYYDSYRSAVLPANLLQAQRDFFGAHTYERIDKPRGEMFHTDWPEVIG